MEKKPNFEYVMDLDGEGFGVWSFKVFRSGDEALSYAENVAHNNPELTVSLTVRPLTRKKNLLRVDR